jgi:hypothetical protein
VKYASESAAGLGCIATVALVLTQGAACVALLHHWGVPFWLAVPLVLIVAYVGLTPLLIVGCFLGAYLAWGWHWLGALALTLPGLVLLGFLATAWITSTVASHRP